MVANLGKMIGFLHGIGFSVEKLDKKVGVLHGIDVSVEKTGQIIQFIPVCLKVRDFRV